MGKSIILRVKEGTVLSPGLVRTLGELLPNYILETYQQAPDYKISYTRRVESLYQAFLFIIDAYPLNPDVTPFTAQTMKNYASECKNACNLEKESIEDLQNVLDQFTAKLVDILVNNWIVPKGGSVTKDHVKDAIACLNEAECYQLMSKHGRADLATLTTIMNGKEIEYVVQVDKSIPPHYDLLINELISIKKANYPKTPKWFALSPDYQQAYFCNLKSPVKVADITNDFKNFISTWTDINAQSLNLEEDLKRIHNNSQPIANWYKQLNTPFKEMIKILSELSVKSINKNLEELNKKLNGYLTKQEFKNSIDIIANLPQWYWILSHRKQFFLEHVLKNAPTVEDAVDFVSSRHRDLPLPSNFAAHRLYTINCKNEVVAHFEERYRSSHIASRDGLNHPDSVQERHSDSNLVKVMEAAKPNQQCLLQTLISPLYAVRLVPNLLVDCLPELPPDLDLNELARSAVARNKLSINIAQHNHPYNIAKRVYYTHSNDKDSLALLAIAQKFVSTIPGLQLLVEDYRNTLDSSMGTATFWDYDGRELFLSSLEHLIILTLGGLSYGSCVSGKDRKAIELLHTDSMLLYKHIYGIWPKFGDPKEKDERKSFVRLFVSLYVSRHQQEHAGQNAPGSEGIKTPAWYLPQDMSSAITRFMNAENTLKNDDRLATNNEVKNIRKNLITSLLPIHELHCELMAKQLGEALCLKLYNALRDLINENKRFYINDSWAPTLYKKEPNALPEGIRLIHALMLEETSGKDNVERFTKIFSILVKRPDKDESRTAATNSVYSRLRDILWTSSSVANSEVLVNAAVNEWSNLFDKSKKSNAAFSAHSPEKLVL
jgi:hypothetical protein